MDNTELPIESAFSQARFESQVDRMSHEQAKDFCKILHRQMLVQNHVTKKLLAADLEGRIYSEG